jgi:hypothetical protein
VIWDHLYEQVRETRVVFGQTRHGEETKCNACCSAQPALLSRPRSFVASNMQAPTHLSTAQPMALCWSKRRTTFGLQCESAQPQASFLFPSSRRRSGLHVGSHGTERKSGKPGAHRLTRERIDLFQNREHLGSGSKLHEGVKSSTTITVPS